MALFHVTEHLKALSWDGPSASGNETGLLFPHLCAPCCPTLRFQGGKVAVSEIQSSTRGNISFWSPLSGLFQGSPGMCWLGPF